MREEYFYKDFLDAFGEDVQYDFTFEEMGELTKAICKYKRKRNSCTEEEKQKLISDIIEEIADVKICLEELMYLFNAEDKVKQVEDYKFARGQERIKAHNINLQVKRKK